MFIGRTDINEKGEIFLDLKLLEIKQGELDRRLESWLDSIGYVTEPDKIVFHEEMGEEDIKKRRILGSG